MARPLEHSQGRCRAIYGLVAAKTFRGYGMSWSRWSARWI